VSARLDARLPARAGMSLVEVVVAFTIFAGALLGLARFGIDFARTVNRVDVRAVASEIAADRLETVKGGTRYDALDSLFAEPTPVPVAGFADFRRQTLFRRVGGQPTDATDYKVVTVIVQAPQLSAPLRRSTVIGDF
jgi:hypothetical protein